MTTIVKITGIAITLLGLMMLISPISIKLWLKSWEAGKRPAIAVLINFLIGILLLASASDCTITWIPLSIGVLSVVKGIILLVYGPKRLIMKASIWLEPRITLIRFASVVPMALGVMLIMSV